MAQQSPANAAAAYDMLLEELDAEIDRLNKAGGRAFAAGDHARAQDLLASVRQLTDLRAGLVAWGSKLSALFADSAQEVAGKDSDTRSARVRESPRRRKRGSTTRSPRPPRGARTPEAAYRVPILTVLVEMGGSGATAAVLDRVYPMVKDRLTDYDRAYLNSRSNTPRWRNAAAWCRKKLCDEGLLRTDSPSGLWEISDKGRRWLATQGKAT